MVWIEINRFNKNKNIVSRSMTEAPHHFFSKRRVISLDEQC